MHSRGVRHGILLLLALAVAATVGIARGPTSTTAAAPVEMSVACALKSNGLMRYVTSSGECTKNETAVTIKPGPVLLCVQPDCSVRKVNSFSQCKAPASQLTLPPTSGTVYFCAANSTGVLRDNISDPSQCTSSEFPVMVTPNDQAPSVLSTSPANGATHVATNTNITVTFSES